MSELFLFLYFSLLGYVAFYGIHLFWLIALFLRQRSRPTVAMPPVSDYPRVTVQLPVYNERAVVVRLIDAAASLDWPRERLTVQILDDSDDETTALAAEAADRWRLDGLTMLHLRRGSRAGYKAGALAYGLQQTSDEFIAIFDADNVPKADFLKRLIPYFADPAVGLVQARWSFLNRNQSLLCRAQALYLDAHFFIEQAARSASGLFMNFNGTAGIWRKDAILSSGGWQSQTLTEDLDLSYRAQLNGWTFRFVESVDVPTELPDSVRAFKAQQFRWAKGCLQTGRLHLGSIFRSTLPFRIKLGSFFHLTQRTTSVALLLLACLLVPALVIRLEGGMLKVLLLDLPIFLAGTVSMSLYYSLAYQKSRDQQSTASSLLLPALTSLGIGLAVTSTRAVISALFQSGGEFCRTPKSGTVGTEVRIVPPTYRIRRDSTMLFEGLLGCYALGAAVWAVILGLYPSIPFLLTFAFGFCYLSIRSWREGHA